MTISTELLQLLRQIGLIFELLSALFSIIYFYKIKRSPILKYFAIMLWYIFLNDLLGLIIRKYVSDYNSIIYNLYYSISFTYFFILYIKNLNNKKSKLLTKLFLLAYIVSCIINGFFENYLIELQTIPYILASLFLVTTIALYFIDIINSNTVLHVKSSLLFWISTGLLLYYISNLPFRIIRNYYTELADSSTMILISFISTVVMNVCFCIGYILHDNVSLAKQS